jgi:acetyltransferase-like isoleucine patch superfamily enzyme
MENKFVNFLGQIAKRTYKIRDENIPDWKYLYYFFYQKILLFNFYVPWPVHYTSMVNGIRKIEIEERCSPGSGPNQYIQGGNGIVFGRNIWLGPGVQIISQNHDINDYTKHLVTKPIKIESDVWIGANTVVLPAIRIGENVVIGAGSVVTQDIPKNSVAVGNPCKVVKEKEPYQGK